MGDSILFPPTLSSSSMNITQGALALASPTKQTTKNKMLLETDIIKYIKHNKYWRKRGFQKTIKKRIDGGSVGREGSMQFPI